MLARHRKKLIALAVILLSPVLAHLVVGWWTAIEPPPVPPPSGEVEVASASPRLARLGPAYVRRRGEILEVRLAGSPAEIGHQHGRLLYDEMVENEGILYDLFEQHVPAAPLRWLIVDISRVGYREVDHGMTESRLTEIAAQARAFSPDPYDGFLPTYHRFVFLNALYDISLSFEHSPLIGCTSFVLAGDAAEDGHTLLARNFDFEAHPIFDAGKAVFLVFEEGHIPYASVSWPGLVGVVTGVNAEGVSLAVHGARAGEARSRGEPVVHTLRRALAQARTTAEALELITGAPAMVSHMVIVADASGDAAVVERAPGAPAHVRRIDGGKLALTNHLEGPLQVDPKNQRVEDATSTWPRRRRLDELLSNLPPGADVERAVQTLRDKRAAGGGDLPLGHRHAIDALIATHSVVIDATARELWVSEGPHLVGRFVRFDLQQLLDPSYEPGAALDVEALPADAIASDGQYDEWVAAGRPHGGTE